ncbi:MAG: beta-ketoacyl-[acyl-carrier-protein] synthase family protein [Candidatus Omnitrophica bacterium]|nr:beta-ketoacyl-[acyl-carrier-protein] synthase family protein [Candidatus Omnitrophota bacterium]MDD5352240.1 beta-ketoacyl-[acyl-carrier-protein] synthase family protein [Candidatus Omnitrophota bacterium]MDD5549838.1 beta-ketoacyl-[acyl-carrier-protein] synthase family protein [Candidatus Omnitrophota bacterium]
MKPAKKRIVITGIGIITSNGIGKDEFWKNLEKGVSGIKQVSLFDTGNLKTHTTGEIKDFDAAKYLGEKGLRLLDRTTKIVNVAAKFALDDANLKIDESNTNEVGVVLGTTLGSVWSISEFDKTSLREGPRGVNPALFPNTVINSPASQISIRFVIKGFNTTIATGFTASLDALRYACDFIQLNRAKAVVVGGVEELCIQTYLGFYKLKFLAGSKDSDLELSCPFDKRRNGIIFGEGASMVVIEDLESAQARGAKIYAEILSFGSYFDPYRINKYNRLGPGIRAAMRSALENAQLTPRNIDYICANANSTKEADLIEAEAIKDVFGDQAKKVPVSSIKSMVGESFSACGALSLAASLGAIENKFIPPTINYKEPDAECDLDIVANKSRKKELKSVLINTFGPSGTNTCAIIGKFSKN